MDWGNRKDILVFLEQKDGKALNGALECLTPARALAQHTGGQVLAVLMGTDNAGAAEKVRRLVSGHDNPRPHAEGRVILPEHPPGQGGA